MAAPPARPAGDALPEMMFCSPDRARAQRVVTKLRGLGNVSWEPDGNMSQLARRLNSNTLVLLDFAPDAVSRSTDTARQITYLAPQVPLIGVGSTQGPSSSVLAALRAGVREFIDIDGDPEEIRTVLRKMVAQTAPPAATETHSKRRGRVVALVGVRGGVGCSTLAAHLAVMAQQRLNRPQQASEDNPERVLLLDLGHPNGDGQLYLDLHSEFHFGDAVRNAYRFDATLARTALPHHASNLAVLSQPSDVPDVSVYANDEVTLLAERLRKHFDLLLVDLGGLPNSDLHTPLINIAEEIWLIAEQSVGSAVSLDDTLQSLQRSGVRRPLLHLVINRFDPDCGISAEQIAERFGLPLLAKIPERSRVLRSSANLGRMLHETAPKDRYVRALQPLLDRLLPGHTPSQGERQGRMRHLLRHLGVHRWTPT